MKRLDLNSIRALSLDSVGLNPNIYKIESKEFVAGAIRRTASSMCPCASSAIIKTVCDSAAPILNCSFEEFEHMARLVLESLIGNGDLIEEQEVETSFEIRSKGRVLYLRPPSFLRRWDNTIFLIGIAPSNASILPPELEKRVSHFSHVRRLIPEGGEDLPAILRGFGLIELSVANWDRRNLIPETEAPLDYINKMKSKLQNNPGALEGLEIIAPNSNVRYYRGRWKSLSQQTGCFVGRRPQVYGNSVWCYVEVQNGIPSQMTDLPALNEKSLGRDEAWRLQMAIDVNRGNPQEFTVVLLDDVFTQVKFYSPIPSWAQRRWDILAEPADNNGCLFSYRFITTDLFQEIGFMIKKLWLIEKS